MPAVDVPPVLKKDAQLRSAVPVCRSCVISHVIPASALIACPDVVTCQMNKCENQISYMWIK